MTGPAISIENKVLLLIIARHRDRMQGDSIDYALKDTPLADWDFSGAHRILSGALRLSGALG
jgi:hypothetical protein